MRIVLVVLLSLVTIARADGGYLSESLGGGDFVGELGDHGAGAPRVQLGVGYVRGPWAVELSLAAFMPDFGYIDCYGDECVEASRPKAGLVQVGLDLRRAYRVVYSTWTRHIGLDLFVHGGPRWFVGQDGLSGYGGPGIGGAAGAELNVKVVGMFVELGLDLVMMRDRGDQMTGRIPSVAFGVRFGWL
ncbi:MAG: hypothetical protein NT062_10300 [Proteobacteria bacterium]|nr:hypothetical protein [Pseudomonadota bacterium]